MTRRTNSRIAGISFLGYIVTFLTSMAVFGRFAVGEAAAAKLAGIAQHPSAMNVVVLLDAIGCFAPLLLAMSLYAITREQDPDLARIGMVCRLVEGMIVVLATQGALTLRWLATATGGGAPDPASAVALAAYTGHGDVAFTSLFFAVGSTCFAWLFLRGRMIPTWMAWLGLSASILLVVGLPLQLVGMLPSTATMALMIPMLAFEIPVGFWLIWKGAAAPARLHLAAA
jgi:uncharacterized protein DUF4386